MTKVSYSVGTNGYYTTCNTLASAKRQAEGTDYTIKKVYETIEEPSNIFIPSVDKRIKL